MPGESTNVKIGEAAFDIAGVGDWAANHISFLLLIAGVAFIFWLFQKGGFAEKFLDYRIRGRELDAKQLDDTRILVDIFREKYGRDDPLLPFDDESGKFDL